MIGQLYGVVVWLLASVVAPEASCPFVGPLSARLQQCLKPLGIEGADLLTSNPFHRLSPSDIYHKCYSLTEDDISSAIQCAKQVRDECRFADVTEEVRLIDMAGVKKAIVYICENKDVVNYKPSILCLDLQRGRIERCIRAETAKANARLLEMGKAQDKIAIRCSKLRVESYCYETVLMRPCGYRLSVFKRTVMDHMIPQTCNCRKEYYDREQDPEDCYDTSDCLEHLRPGMVEKDLYKGVVLGMQTVEDVKHFCDYYNFSTLENRIVKGIKCIERSSLNCTYKSRRFKQMRVDTDDLIEASTIICDRIHTLEQYQECFERGQRNFKKCEENQWMIEKPHLRSKGLSDNLEEYLDSLCRIKRRCVEHTFRVCSVMLLDVLESVNDIISPVLCKDCKIKGARIMEESGGHRTTFSWLLGSVFAALILGR